MIDDFTGLGVDATPEAERLREHQSQAIGLAGKLESARPFDGSDCNRLRHEALRTTCPTAAERMQSFMSAKATVTPILPGA